VVAKATEDGKGVFFRRKGDRKNMCFCETNRIGRRGLFVASVVMIVTYTFDDGFFNPVRFPKPNPFLKSA